MKIILLPEEEGGIWRIAPNKFPEPESYVLGLIYVTPTILYYDPEDWGAWAQVIPNKKKGEIELKKVAEFDEQVLWTELTQMNRSQIRFRETVGAG